MGLGDHGVTTSPSGGRPLKPATIRDVASRAAVSVASVSRVLNGAGPVALETRDRVMEAVRELSYVPHSGARSLSMRRTDTVGVILPDLHGEFFSELIRGLDRAARERGLHLLVSSSHDDEAEVEAALGSMRGRVDGIIIMSPHLDPASVAGGMARSVPVVALSGDGGRGDVAGIGIDNAGGARAMTAHLVEGGARRVAHIRGPSGHSEAEARMAGYAAAVAEAGQPSMVETGDFTQASGYRAMHALLDRSPRPDAVFAANDTMAIGALLAIREAGLRLPEDIALGGFDDVPMAALLRPALTTMRISIAELGERALARLAGAIQSRRAAAPADPEVEIVRPLLVVRQSTFNHRQGEGQSPASFSQERQDA